MKRIWVLMAVAFVDMIGLMMILPLLPYYAREFGAQPALIGLMVASFPVAQLAASPLWGRMSDHYGRRPVLMIGLTASAIAYLIFSVAGSMWLLFVSRIAQGLGGGTTGVAQAYVADTLPPHERAKGLGWLSAATSAAVIFGPGLGSVSSHLGNAAPGLIAAALCVINVAFAWYWLPESRKAHAPATRPDGTLVPPQERRSVRSMVKEVLWHPGRPLARLIWIYTIAMLAFNALPPIWALYLSDEFCITKEQIGYFFMVFGIVGVIMRTAPVGWINARLGEVRTMRLGATVMMLGLITVPLAHSIPTFVMGQVMLPIGTALLFPANSALVSHRANRIELGQTLGVQQAFRGVAAIIGPIYSGLAYQTLGPPVPFFISGVIIACVLLITLREPAHESSSAPAPA